MEHYSYKKTRFDPGYEQYVRVITNPNGRGNAAYDVDREREMPPQDSLVYAEITLGLTTGIACEFGWASGRRDVWAVLDLPVEAVPEETVRQRAALIEQLKQEHNHAKPH